MSTGFARSFVDVEHPGLVVLVSTTHGANEFFSIIIPPLFPFLVPGLGIDYARASLLVVVFFATYSIFQLPVGPLADVYSNRNLLVGGMIVLALGVAMVAMAPSFPLMLVGMTVAAIGGSTYHPTGMAVISDAESDATHGRSMGIHGTLGAAGTVAAPLLMVGVAEAAGWRTALLAGSALGLAFAVVLYALYPRMCPAEGSERSFAEAIRVAADRTAGVRETTRRLREFVLSPTMLKLGALFVIVGAEVRAVQTFTASFAVATTGMGEAYGGAMLSLTMVTAGIASMVAGYGVDRVDRVWFALACFAATAAVVIALVTVPLSAAVLPLGFALLGIVLYSVYPATNAIAAGASTESASGSLFAVTNTAAAIGGAAGPFLLGVLADATSLSEAYLATTGIAGLGIVVALWARDIA